MNPRIYQAETFVAETLIRYKSVKTVTDPSLDHQQ